MTTEQEEWLTTEEASDLVKFTPQTIRQWCREGRLPGRRVGKRQWRFKRSDLLQFLEAQAVKVTP